jgi:D,D-heptose 1,7-bisphosphate phosphatase
VNKAAFFDRDGTINVNTGHLHVPDKLEFIPGRPELIKHYNDAGYKVIVVTNQAGIAKGYYTVEDMLRFHQYMNQRLWEYCGAHIDAFYYCPHHPDYTGLCHCRKPEPGMLEQAIKDFDIDVTQSVLYGDKSSDIEAGEKCGIKSVLLKFQKRFGFSK